jgi:hypothetical protein
MKRHELSRPASASMTAFRRRTDLKPASATHSKSKMGKRDKRKKNLTAEDKEKAKAKTEKKDQKAQQKQKKKELNDVGAWQHSSSVRVISHRCASTHTLTHTLTHTHACTHSHATYTRTHTHTHAGEDDIDSILADLQRREATKAVVTVEANVNPSPRMAASLTAHPSADTLVLFGGEFMGMFHPCV